MKRLALALFAGCSNDPPVYGVFHFENGGATPFTFSLLVERGDAGASSLHVSSTPCDFTGTLDDPRSGHVDPPQSCTLSAGQSFAFVTADGAPPLGGFSTVVIDTLSFSLNADDLLVTNIALNDGAQPPRRASVMGVQGHR